MEQIQKAIDGISRAFKEQKPRLTPQTLAQLHTLELGESIAVKNPQQILMHLNKMYLNLELAEAAFDEAVGEFISAGRSQG